MSYELNPRRIREGAAIGVLSDLEALAQAIDLRRQGRIARLVAGPNLVVLPSDAAELMNAPEIDLCIVPCAWVKENYTQDCPALQGRLAVWPAGVDCAYWSPAGRNARPPRRALVFRKVIPGHAGASDEEVEAACKLLRSHDYTVMRLEYGRFSHRAYRRILRMCDLSVVFGACESQGMALVEAWSVGVPTLVSAYDEFSYRGSTYECSAAPYVSPSTGAFFRDLDELQSLLSRWEQLATGFAPRDWVLSNMTDEISADMYWALAQDRARARVPVGSMSDS